MKAKPATESHVCPACWITIPRGKISGHRAVCIRWWHLQNLIKLGIRKP